MTESGIAVLKSLEERLESSQRENAEALALLRGLMAERSEAMRPATVEAGPVAGEDLAPPKGSPERAFFEMLAKDEDLLAAMDAFSDMVERNADRWDAILSGIEADQARMLAARQR